MTFALLYIACEPHSGSHFCFGKLHTLPPFLVSISAIYLFCFHISNLAIHILHVYTFYIGYLSISIQLYMHFNLSKYMDIFEEYATSQAVFRLAECEALGW